MNNPKKRKLTEKCTPRRADTITINMTIILTVEQENKSTQTCWLWSNSRTHNHNHTDTQMQWKCANVAESTVIRFCTCIRFVQLEIFCVILHAIGFLSRVDIYIKMIAREWRQCNCKVIWIHVTSYFLNWFHESTERNENKQIRRCRFKDLAANACDASADDEFYWEREHRSFTINNK